MGCKSKEGKDWYEGFLYYLGGVQAHSFKVFIGAFDVQVWSVSWGICFVFATEGASSHGVFGEILWWEFCN